jgi:hypothetical protein
MYEIVAVLATEVLFNRRTPIRDLWEDSGPGKGGGEISNL